MMPDGRVPTRVLLIAPKFFGYEREIKEELEALGCEVDYYDERPSSAALAKVLLRLVPEMMGLLTRRYARRVIAETKGRGYAVVLMIKGEGFSAESVRALRAAHPTARFVFYLFDSLSNVRNGERKLSLFDRAYSFDRLDCLAHSELRHLPLFFSRRHEEIAERRDAREVEQDIDLLGIGSLHSDRYVVADRIIRSAAESMPDVRVMTYWFYQSRWVFALRRVFDRHFRPVPWRAVRYRALDGRAVGDLMVRSRAFIDVHHAKQTGLTMRTIESVGTRTKLITTNHEVTRYPFYNTANILVVDRTHPVVPASFLASPYEPLEPAVYAQFRLRAWLDEIMGWTHARTSSAPMR